MCERQRDSERECERRDSMRECKRVREETVRGGETVRDRYKERADDLFKISATGIRFFNINYTFSMISYLNNWNNNKYDNDF